MLPSADVRDPHARNWVYVSLTVRDGDRLLKPTQVSFDFVLFAEPPRLVSKQIEIILVNGDAEQRHIAAVAPHPDDATCIPIQLVAGPS